MFKKSITWRFFFYIVLLFIFSTIVGYVGQSVFFEKFYIHNKVKTVSEQIEIFIQEFQSENWSELEQRERVGEFFKDNNSQLAILGEHGVYYGQTYYMEIDVSGESLAVPLNEILLNGDQGDLASLGLEKGAVVVVEGYQEDDYLVPESITTNSGKWERYSDAENVVSYSGIVTNIMLPEDENQSVTNQIDMFQRAIYYWLMHAKEMELEEKLYVYDYTDTEMGIDNKVFIRPISTDGDIEDIIISMVSLQPVDEAVEAVRQFYSYVLSIIFVVSAIFAFYLSKYLTKNLRKIDKVTTKMVDLDFSETIDIKSDNEIGHLAKSINKLSDNLKHAIEDLQVANEMLQSDIEKERQLEETRRNFIAGVSHELKTPLSVIRSYSEAIHDGVSVDKSKEYLEIVLHELTRMDTLIVDMLELAKLESGTYILRQDEFSIIELIDDVNYKMMLPLQERDMDIEVETDADYIVVGDRNRITQVLVNFMSNSLRYGEEESVILIKLDREENMLKITIENNGPHIPDELIEKLWDRFYRTDSARARTTGGTGLGLSIVKNILQLHGVEYGAENVENGVSFYFYLPIQEEIK